MYSIIYQNIYFSEFFFDWQITLKLISAEIMHGLNVTSFK